MMEAPCEYHISHNKERRGPKYERHVVVKNRRIKIKKEMCLESHIRYSKNIETGQNKYNYW